MRSRCHECGEHVEWELIEEYEDGGARYEVYRCPECGTTRTYVVG